MEENIKNCKKLKNYWKEESDSTRDDTIFIDSSDNELSDKKDTNIINENITNDDGYFKKPFSPSTCHVSTTEINNDVTRERASSFTRSGTHRLRDSRRRLAMRQRRLNSGSTKNHSIKDSHLKEFSRLQAHLQSIPHLMKSSPAIQRLSSSVSSLIENGYNNISTSLPKKRRNTNENKKDSSILTTYPISPYHRSNMVRNSVRKETIVKKETSSETTLPEQNVVGNNQKNEKLMGKIFNEDDINYSLQDKAYNSCGIEEEDNPNEGIKNIFKGLGGAMKTSSLVNIQSNTEEKYNIQELSTDIKIAVRNNMWFKNFFFGRRKNNKRANEEVTTERLTVIQDEENIIKKEVIDDHRTNNSSLLINSITCPTDSKTSKKVNLQDSSVTLPLKEKKNITTESASCDSSTVTNVPLHKLFIGSSSACFQADFTASQESGNNDQQNQEKPTPSQGTDKDLSFLTIMPTLLTASKESDLEKILKCDTKRKPFQNFLEQQFCVENLNFYLAVEEYRKIPDEEMTRRKAVGLQIFERHFITNSTEPVNIDNSTNRTIKDAVLAGKFTCDLYDVAQYQIFHLLKYDCWPRYLRAVTAEDKDALGLDDTSDGYSKKFSESGKDSTDSPRLIRQTQEVDKFCTLLSNDGCSSERISLRDPRESVAKWIANIAVDHGMDKFATEVVDAQTGSTIDPARQAVDALHNRCVRLVSVVFVTVEFLSPNATVKSSTPPQPARVVTVKARHSLTIGSAIRPLFAKYMIDPTQTAICFYGGIDQVPPRTQLGSIPPRKLSVMTYQQLQERQSMPKKDLHKLDMNASPNMSQKDQNLPFHQHGDVAFYVLPMDNDGKSHKHSAIRSNSSNPRAEGSSTSESIMSRFRRKASQAVGSKDSDQNSHQNNSLKPSNKLSDTKSTITHTRSGIATNNSQNKGAAGRKNSASKVDNSSKKATISPIDVPYCGENQKADEAFMIQKNELMKEEEELKKKKEKKNEVSGSQGTNGNLARVPAIYASAVRSDKEQPSTPNCQEPGSSIGWQPADYV